MWYLYYLNKCISIEMIKMGKLKLNLKNENTILDGFVKNKT